MYSMVLMAALTTGSDLPDCGRRGGWGCCGCYGGYGGCWGGCYGGFGYGGGGYGGWGGGYAGYGSGYGGSGGGASGRGGLVPGPGYYWGGYGGAVYVPRTSDQVLASNGKPSANHTRASVIVHLPADATLTVEGKRMETTSSTRHFVSPPLTPGKRYHYILQAEVQRNGETVTTTQRVEVRAGKTAEVRLTFPEGTRTAKRARPLNPSADKGTLAVKSNLEDDR